MTLYIMFGMLALTSLLVFRRDGIAGVRHGAAVSIAMTRSVLAQVVMGMLLAGMAQVVLPTEVVSGWMGSESGIRGVLIGVAVGSVVPAGPFVVLPLMGGLLAMGAGPGPIAALITAWSVIAVSRTFVFDIPFLGPAFTLSKLLVALPFPFIAGFITPVILRLVDCLPVSGRCGTAYLIVSPVERTRARRGKTKFMNMSPVSCR